MTDSSPRWPGTKGGPGLDFSPYRKQSADDAAGKTAKKPAAKASETAQIAKPEVGKASAAPVVDRAAKTRQEWAATPVAATAAKPAGSKVTAVVASEKSAASEKPIENPSKGASRRTRKARLRIARIDPWSVMKTTFLFSIAFGIMLWIFVAVLWSITAASGAFDSMSDLANKVFSDGQTTYDVKAIISASRVLGFTAVIAVIDVVILTAVSTLLAFLYNLAATVMGGLEITLAED